MHLLTNCIVALGWNATPLIIGNLGVEPGMVKSFKNVHAFSEGENAKLDSLTKCNSNSL